MLDGRPIACRRLASPPWHCLDLQAGPSHAGDADADEEDDENFLMDDDDSVVIDDEEDEELLRAEADAGGDGSEERHVWLLEQCLAWGGEQRLRLRLTIAAYPGPSPLHFLHCTRSRGMMESRADSIIPLELQRLLALYKARFIGIMNLAL